MPEPNELSGDRAIYRALLRDNWIDPDTNTILPVAFYLRPTRLDGEREKGLSVLVTNTCPEKEDCQRIVPKLKTRGACSLKVEDVKQQGLTVEVTRSEKGEILGLPHQDEFPKEAKDHAEALASKSQLEKLWAKG